MNKPNQVVPSFSHVILSSDQKIPSSWTVILFDIINTDGTDKDIYDASTGEFSAPVSGWYDIQVNIELSSAGLSGLRIIKNRDVNFPVIAAGVLPKIASLFTRVKLGLGESLRVEVYGPETVLALSSAPPPAAYASTCTFTLAKRFDDAKSF